MTPPKYGSMVAKNVPDRDPRTTNKGPKISASGPTKTSEDGNTRPKAEKPIDSSQKTEKKQVAKAPVLPRNQSDIFKSFSKSRSNLKREDTDSSVAASPTTSAVDSVS